MADEQTATPDIEWIDPAPLRQGAPAEDVVFAPEPVETSSRWEPSARTLAAARWRGRIRDRYRRWHQLSASVPSPRVDSMVRRVLRCDLADAVALVEDQMGTAIGLHLDGPLRPDPSLPVQRAPAQLLIPWSRPHVPVWLAVEPWWRDQALVSLWLRSTRRWRYPVRYFSTAHRVMDQVTSMSGSSSAGNCIHQPAR